MKMAKASQADLKMALELSTMLETLERGYFPAGDDKDFIDGHFDADSGDDCRIAMEQILDKLKTGSLFRVVFGMSVLLDPKNEAIDHSLDYLEHHPKVRRHDDLVKALRVLRESCRWVHAGCSIQDELQQADAVLASIPEVH